MVDDHGLVPRRLPNGNVVWEVPAPDTCPDGHPLRPVETRVGFALCGCDKVKPRSRGHITWTCRCGAVRYEGAFDGHDDRRLGGAETWGGGPQPS